MDRPTSKEIQVLVKILERQRAAYEKDPKAALQLLAVGEAPRNVQIHPAELAAWTIVASTILNLDESLTKS